MRTDRKVPQRHRRAVFSALVAATVMFASGGANGLAARRPAPKPATAPRFTLTDLGAVADADAPLRLNDAGQVLLKDSGGIRLWSAGTRSDPLPFGVDLNDRGQVVGEREVGSAPDGAYREGTHAALWAAGKVTILAPKDKGRSTAVAINNAGQVACGLGDPGGIGEVYRWDSGKIVYLKGSAQELSIPRRSTTGARSSATTKHRSPATSTRCSGTTKACAAWGN